MGEEKASKRTKLPLPGGLGELSTSVLGSLIAGAILLVVGTSAVTVAVTNNNTNTNTVGRDERPEPARPSSTTAGGRPMAGSGNVDVADSPPTSTYPVRFDPSEDGSTWVQSNQSKFFFDRQFFVSVGQVSGKGAGRVISHMTLQEGTLAQCRFENVRPGRYFYRHSGREYEVQLDLPEGLGFADVNIAEWDGRKTYEQPCAGNAIEAPS